MDNSQNSMRGTIQSITGFCHNLPGDRTTTDQNHPLEQRSQAYDPRPHNATHTVIRGCDTESRWLLVCAKGKKRPTTLSQLDLCATPSDKQLFTELTKAYVGLRGKWTNVLSLKKVQSIRFVQVKHSRGKAENNELIIVNSSNSIFEILSISVKSPICLPRPERTSISTSHTTLYHRSEKT